MNGYSTAHAAPRQNATGQGRPPYSSPLGSGVTPNHANGANGKGTERSSLAMGFGAVYIRNVRQSQFCLLAECDRLMWRKTI